MSGFEGPVLKGMNPFSNNQPRLTASERIRNKRDASIYQTEKQQFQTKKKCGNENVKYYDNGTIRSMKSYKLQKSLARGNVLCEDCDDKGLLCRVPNDNDDLASIKMGNNTVSEYWGGADLDITINDDPTNIGVEQSKGFPVINVDISGSWDPSANDYKGCGTIDCSYGYLDNLIRIPRNLDGSGIVIDPSNILFPDELCDPFRYLQKSNLKTYLVVTGIIPIGGTLDTIPSSCFDNSYNLLIDKMISNSVGTMPGFIRSLCCIGHISSYYGRIGTSGYHTGEFGIFEMYIELFHFDFATIKNFMNITPTFDNMYGWRWPHLVDQDSIILFIPPVPVVVPWGILIQANMIQSMKLIQGTIEPWLNQTKYNNTDQTYMSCLENGTKKINFTKQNTKIPIKNSFCKNCPITITDVATGGRKSYSGIYTLHIFDTSGDFVVTSNISNVYYLIIGAGGGGGTGGFSSPDPSGCCGGGGGGGGARGALLPGPSSTDLPEGPISVAENTYPIVVGSGGQGGDGANPTDNSNNGYDGSDSSFNNLISTGGNGGKGELTLFGAGAGGASGKPLGDKTTTTNIGGISTTVTLDPHYGCAGGGGAGAGSTDGGGGDAAVFPGLSINGGGSFSSNSKGEGVESLIGTSLFGVTGAIGEQFAGGGGGAALSRSLAAPIWVAQAGIGSWGGGTGGIANWSIVLSEYSFLPPTAGDTTSTSGASTGGGGGGSPGTGSTTIKGGDGANGTVMIRYLTQWSYNC